MSGVPDSPTPAVKATAQKPTLTELPIEKMTMQQIMALLRGDDIRTKGDLRDWTGSPAFHLSRE